MNIVRCISSFVITLLLISVSQSADVQQVERFVFTDATKSRHVNKKTLTARDFGKIAAEANWSVTKETLQGGKQQGVDLITVDNGTMKIRIIPTRGMSILDMQVGDLRIGWESPVKEVVHPSFIDLDTRGGLGWLDGFNEWMVRCGIEFAGHPGVDNFIDNTGAEAEMNLTLHGKVGNIPASHVEVLIHKKKPHRITIRGVVHERMFFGPKIELATEISTLPNSTEVTVTDTVTNRGANDQEIMLIYHTNYGSPILEAGAKLAAPIKALAPMNETAIAGIDEYQTYAAPDPNYIEQVYLAELFGDEMKNTLVCLHDQAGENGASISFNLTELPYFTIWKNTTARENGYVTGLEPGTCYPFNRSVERKAGRIPKLAPGELKEFSLTFGVHLGRDNVSSILQKIDDLQAGREIKIDRKPPAH